MARKISENANAIEESISNRYDALVNMFSQGSSRYDFGAKEVMYEDSK